MKPHESSAVAILARAGSAFQQSVNAQIALAEVAKATNRTLWAMYVVRGLIITWDDPDFPLVLAHDYGCEVTA